MGEHIGPGQEQTPNPAAERRAAWVQALEVEREGYVRAGKTDRVAAVDAAIAAAKGEVKGRTTSKRAQTDG